MKKNANPAKKVEATSNANTETNFSNNSNEVTATPSEPTPTAPDGEPGTVAETEPKPKAKTVREIMEKNQKVNQFLESLRSLDEAEKSLDSFNLSSSKISDTLEIKDGRGNSFKTSKTFLLEKVIACLIAEMRAKSEEIEAELINLETN